MQEKRCHEKRGCRVEIEILLSLNGEIEVEKVKGMRTEMEMEIGISVAKQQEVQKPLWMMWKMKTPTLFRLQQNTEDRCPCA
jgi:hypothetical protein